MEGQLQYPDIMELHRSNTISIFEIYPHIETYQIYPVVRAVESRLQYPDMDDEHRLRACIQQP